MTAAIDLFAGPGGFSTAARSAGVEVVWAGNHDQAAIDVHRANHPGCEHAREDLRVVDWGTLPVHDLCLASPECDQHSEASQPSRARKGSSGKAKRKRSRALAYEVLHAVDACSPEAVIVENVPAFRRWRLFDHWVEGFRVMGYHVNAVERLASHHRVPQRRLRIFVVATRKPLSPFALTFNEEPEPGFGDFIDWDDGNWRPISAAPPGARARMLAGRRFGIRYWAQNVTGHRGKPLTDPLSTVTCQDQHVVIDGDNYRTLTVRETARAMGFPDDYAFPVPPTVAKAKLGDAVCPPVAAAIIERVMHEVSL